MKDFSRNLNSIRLFSSTAGAVLIQSIAKQKQVKPHSVSNRNTRRQTHKYKVNFFFSFNILPFTRREYAVISGSFVNSPLSTHVREKVRDVPDHIHFPFHLRNKHTRTFTLVNILMGNFSVCHQVQGTSNWSKLIRRMFCKNGRNLSPVINILRRKRNGEELKNQREKSI